MTQKFNPTVEYTPSVKAEPSSLPPELLASFTGSSSYFINSLTTTYLYYNTFTVDSRPVVLTSRETVTNVVTVPGYMSPTIDGFVATGSRVYETETYFTTYTFSKTLLLADATSEVVTTKEIITQVVVTEALVPPTATQQVPLNTPMPPGMMDEITKTYLTTFTHLFTEVNDHGELVIRSSTSVASEVVTEKLNAIDSTETMGLASMFQIKLTEHPTLTGWFKKPGSATMRSPSTLLPTRSIEIQDMKFTTIQPSETINIEAKTVEPVMIYATKTYYTTYTYFTTILGDGSRTKASVHSRTKIISNVVTEALSTSFDAYYLNALKSSYLSKHSTMIDITSSVREITPTKIMEPVELPGTLVTESFSHPHWPKDNDELAFEMEGTTVNSISGVEVNSNNESPIQAEIQVSSASSEEHFDEIKEEVNHIVNVLTDSEESATSGITPSSTYQEPIYSTVSMFVPDSVLTASETVSSFYQDNGLGYVEQVTYKDPVELVDDDILMENMHSSGKPITHLPTPPLVISSSPLQPLTTTKPKTKKPFDPYLISTDFDIFPDIGPPPQKSTMIDFPPEAHEYSEEDYVYSSMIMADRYPLLQHSTSILAKRTGTILFDPVTPVFNSENILTLVSHIADNPWNDYEENKEEEEVITSPNIYNIHTTFDSFVVPTSPFVQVPMISPSVYPVRNVSRVVIRNSSTVYNLTTYNDLIDGDMKIHHLAADDLLIDDGSGSGSGSGEGAELDEIVTTDPEGSGSGAGEVIEMDVDYREDDHIGSPDGGEVGAEIETESETFTAITESPIPPFPPRTRYTTSRRPDKRKKTKRPFFESDISSKEEDSGESSTKIYSLKPNFDVLAGNNADVSVSDESDNNSDNKKESEQENDDQSSESLERPQDDEYNLNPGPSKSSITFPALGPGLIQAPGAGPVASSTSIDWKPFLKLGALGLGGLGASSLTKLAPWFNSMAGSFMKGSLLPLARNDTSSSHSNLRDRNRDRERDRDRDRPIFHRRPPGDRDRDRDRPHVEHADPIYIPVRDMDDSRPIDERIPRRPITSHAKDSNMRPVSLERDQYLPGRGHHSPPFDVGPDINLPPRHNYNFKPPNDRQPNIYTQAASELNLHKNGEYSSSDPNIRVINGVPVDFNHAPSELPVEGKTDFIMRPIQNILNGNPMFDGPGPGPVIPLRPPFQSGEVHRPGFRPGERPHPDITDALNDIPDSPRKPVQELPVLRPVPPTDGIILPHRVRGDNGNSRHPPAEILNAFKRPFMPPPRHHQNSKEEWPKPLHPFKHSEEIINLNPPLPPRHNQQNLFDEHNIIRTPPYVPNEPAIHMSPPEMPDPFGDFLLHQSQENRPFGQRPSQHQVESEAASEENAFKDIFGIRPNDHRGEDSRIPDISFHPHNAGEGPFRPLGSKEHHQPHYTIKAPEKGEFGQVPMPHPTGIAGQPSNQFGHNEDDDFEESSENPFQHEFKKMHPSRKPAWPPLSSNAPMSYSYFDDQSHKKSEGAENEIGSSPSPHHTLPTHNIQGFPAAPPLALPPTRHVPPHRQRPSTVYIVQQEEMDAPTTTSTTTTTPSPQEQDVGESSLHLTTQFPKLIIKEIPTRPVAPYYRRSTTSTTTPGPVNVNQNPTSRATIAKLFIRRFSTTTTPPPSSSESSETTTNRYVTWRTRLKPTYMTTSAPSREEGNTTPGSRSNKTKDATETLIDSWLVSPTVNDLQEFLEDFKNKYNNGNSSRNSTGNRGKQSSRPDIILPQRLSSTTRTTTQKPKPSYLDDDDLGDSSAEYDDDDLLEDDMNVGASSERNFTSAGHHPNHHPIHKDPIDAEHFFSTGQGDFAQYYSGTEERDTIIDPVNQKVIKSPFDPAIDHRRNVSHIINRYRATSTSPRPAIGRPIHFRNYSQVPDMDDVEGEESVTRDVIYVSSTPLENEIVELPGPTTYRPRFDVTFHNKMGTTSEEPLPPNPTTFRGEMIRPTTFRPGPDDLPPIGSRLRPDPTRDIISSGKSNLQVTTKRPAPQEGMASFYDDNDSLSQLKMKNQEIHKLPGRTKKPDTMLPDVLEALSDEDFGSTTKPKTTISTTNKSSTEKSVPADGNRKKGEEYDKLEDELYSDEYDSSYDDDAYMEIPPALPGQTDFRPAVQSGTKNSAEGKQNNQFQNPPTPPPGQTRRPGPLEMLTNFFRRPQVRPGPGQIPGGSGRIPFVPNSSREPTRTMLPPPFKGSNERPELQFQANNFNPNVKTIPLNPNADKGGNKANDPIVLIPTTDSPFMTTTIFPRDSGEKTTISPAIINTENDKNDQSPLTSSSNTVTVSPNGNNGIRESTYVEDSEYYEDDEMEEDDKNNVIPPNGENYSGPRQTGPPIKFQPTLAPVHKPPPPPENRLPITIGGHLVNNGHIIRPPTANQRRPPLPPPGMLPGRQPLPPPFARPNLFNPPPPPQNNPEPSTEMEPPPIDSNRLKAPILELPSSGPIRYRPVNNDVHRPNLLRPDDELFKPTTKASKTVHTIASVDDQNQIVATNTFTAILPTRGSTENIEPTLTTQSSSSETTTTSSDIDASEVQLEGSESSSGATHKATDSNTRMTSVVRYSGGRLETTLIEENPASGESTRTRGTNIIIPTRSSTTQTTVSTSSAPNNRLIGLNRRPPLITRQSTTTISSSESSPSSPTTGNSTNPSPVRVTVTMESSVSSSEVSSPSATTSRRPFIPTRTPTRNPNFPWLRKSTVSSSAEKEELSTTSTTTTDTPVTSSFPIRGRQPPTLPTREPSSKEAGFSTTLRQAPSIFNISRSNSRPDLRRTTAVPVKSSTPTTPESSIGDTSGSQEISRVSVGISSKTSSSSTESKERPPLFPRLTTFRPPYRRPTLTLNSSKSRERFTTTLINKVTTSSGVGSPSPTRNPSLFSGILTNRNFTSFVRANANASTTSNPLGESSEYEDYTDEEYEDEDFELEGDGGKSSPVRPDTSSTTNSESRTTTTTTTTAPNQRESSTVATSTSSSSSMSVSTSMSIGNESRTITVSSSEINPTRVFNSNNNQRPSNKPKGILNTMVLRGTLTRVPELPATTKYVTHSETETKTVTETETTVVVTAGTPYTHTIMITKTTPPQTLISTIVGSVTLVNSIDVKPTTVRSTIYAEPTKEVYNFVDTSEDSDQDEHNKVVDVDNDRVLQGGIMTSGSRPRPPHRPHIPPRNHIPKHEPELPTTTKEPKVVRNRPVSIDSGCTANCTNHGNQACRPYANGTKYKCECKPGYARLKRKFPCRRK